MTVISKFNIKEVILHLEEELDLDDYRANYDIQAYLKCGEILEVKYLGCTWDDEYTYQYHIKYLELDL